MGPGVVGRTSYVVYGFLVLALVSMALLRADTMVVAGIFGIGTVVTLFHIGLAYWYANKYPNHAILDGAHFVRQSEIEQAAKDPKIIDVTALPVPNTAPPSAITSRVEGGV